MPRATSVEYIVDEKGRKKSVVMSYKAYLELMEDLADLQVKSERQHEPAENLENVLEEMGNAGRL